MWKTMHVRVVFEMMNYNEILKICVTTLNWYMYCTLDHEN